MGWVRRFTVQLEPYLAQFRLVEWPNGWAAREAVVHLALEGTAVQVLLDLTPGGQRDLQALTRAPTRALERRLGERVCSGQSREVLAAHCRQEEERLSFYAADVLLCARRGNPDHPAACRRTSRSTPS